ncbi:MAG: hypothetical protein QOH41_2662 [Blastocatellia bacterium]|jgi:hypothetical protein|nr:hypothetical protein [Blastocatellia bacterium]
MSGLAVLSSALLRRDERLGFQRIIKQQMAMLHDDGPQETTEETLSIESGFVFSDPAA